MLDYADPCWTTFEQALCDTDDKRRHLLVGNGFSISAHSGFRYGSLIAKAQEVDQGISQLLHTLGARDFEHAMRLAPDPDVRHRLRETFIKTIAATHPARGEIGFESRRACARFLSHFLRKSDHALRGAIFTTNYDLILYWVLVQFSHGLDCWDGFDSDYVWDSPARIPNSHVFYLHGGMHIFERPLGNHYRVVKLEAEKTSRGRTLRDVIRAHLDRGELPTFISEGTAIQKHGRIRTNDYLRAVFRKWGKVCAETESVLFTVGHGLSEVDEHITDKVGLGDLQCVYIGVFGDEDVARAQKVVRDWSVARAKRNLSPLEVRLFRTGECAIWAPNPNLPDLPAARRRRLAKRN
jgi:hypothetical protein